MTEKTASLNHETARNALANACAKVGLDASDSTLVRMGENAMYRLGREVMVRIGRSKSASCKEVRVADWLASSKFPAVRLADGLRTPVLVDGFSVTFWEFLEEVDPPASLPELADVLRALHSLPAESSLDLPLFEPMPKVAERLVQARGKLVSDDEINFLQKLQGELQEDYEKLTFSLPQGVIHGDAHPGNLLRTRDGDVLLIDFEDFAWGPREWDAAVASVRYQAFGWTERSEYEEYVRRYGFDPLSWAGFPVLRAIRELNMTTWLMQQCGHSSRIDKEILLRIADLHEGQRPRQWSTF